MPITLPPLPYDIDALEPHITAQTVSIHHGKHHAAYVSKLNAALEKAPQEVAEKPLETLFEDLSVVPEAARTGVRNHGGGHFNHSLFWQTMAPNAGGKPGGAVGDALAAEYGSFDAFRDAFTDAAVTLFGSGWAWLVAGADGRLVITTTQNQINPLMAGEAEVIGAPILTLDVWEHAYYLDYQNRRPDFIAAWWNLVSWDKVNELYLAATSSG